MTNPFLPAQPAQQPAAPANPFAAPAPAQQQSSNPFGAGVPATSYGTGPVAQTIPQQPQVAPPALDLNRLAAAPAPIVGEGKGALLADMFGRLTLWFPLMIETVQRRPEHISEEDRAKGRTTQQRLTATVVVLDDGQGGQSPIAYGGKPYALPPTPHTESAPLPYVRKAMWINQSRLISQLQPSLPSAPGQAPGMIAGRVYKAGPANSDPWYLIAATEAEVTLVRQYLEAVQAGQFPHPLA